MNDYINFWRGFWLYWLDRERFLEIENHFRDLPKKIEKQAEIIPFPRKRA